MKTFGSALARWDGKGPGFDFVRIFLAMGVLLTHCVQIYFGEKSTIWQSPLWIVDYAILPMFFALSGFLVAGSALRNTLSEFAANRGIRIVPALLVEISLSALFLGPLLTSYSLSQYFSDEKFYAYFLNILGYIHFVLPGVFVQNPLPEIVNGSLWTIPHEIFCYIVMAFLILTGVLKRPKYLLFALLGMFGVAAFAQLIVGNERIVAVFGESGAALFKQLVRLLPYFILGVLAYLFRFKIPFSAALCILSVVALVLIGFLLPFKIGQSALFRMAVCPILTYVTVYLGLLKIPRIPIYWRGDYSYGVYLYGFPIQQTIMYFARDKIGFVTFMVLSIIFATVFASFSWHVIEKPLLKLRNNRRKRNELSLVRQPKAAADV